MTSLPDDVLYDIFHRITVDAQSRSRSEGGVMIEPLFSSHVCRRWRQVALSRGTLWSYLCIDHFCGPRRRERMLAVFHAWLERTGKAPLNFSIKCLAEEGLGPGECRHLELVVQSLVAEQQRWKDVSFCWQFKASSKFTIKLTDMPMLSSITLCSYVRACDGVEIVPQISIARSQQLKYMKLDSGSTFDAGEDPNHSLIRMVRDVPDVFGEVEGAEHCLAILKACPNLEDFRAVFFTPIRSFIPGRTLTETRIVRNVQTLWIEEGEGAMAAAHLVDKLTLPELKYLRFYSNSPPIGPHHVLVEFFERSRPRLEKLEINGYIATPNNLIPVLRMLPTLHELVLTCDDAGELFEGLTRSGDGPIICPVLRYIRLRYLCLGYEDGLKRSLDALYSMAMSRGDEKTVFGTATFMNRLQLPISRIHKDSSYNIIRDMFAAEWFEAKSICVELKGQQT